jgi:DNA-binding ferritin-like protein (Dps family)
LLSLNWPTLTSREEELSSEEAKKLKEITENPWRVIGTNTHVIRNFDMLLSLFEGLEGVYKKGY